MGYMNTNSQRDCLNSMKFLNDGGIILFHDFLPRSFFEESLQSKHSSWTGDVWKVAVELNNSKMLNLKLLILTMELEFLN